MGNVAIIPANGDAIKYVSDVEAPANLRQMQAWVGGQIEMLPTSGVEVLAVPVRPDAAAFYVVPDDDTTGLDDDAGICVFRDPVFLVDEEGLLKGLDVNERAWRVTGQPVVGTLVILDPELFQ